MTPTSFRRILVACALLFLFLSAAAGQKRRVPPGGRLAVVIDERLSALRAAPDLTAKLIQRLGRGHLVSVRGERTTIDGVRFSHVAVTRRTMGWLQSDAVFAPWRSGDDARLVRLLEKSEEYDLIIRARSFLDIFAQSPWRSKVLSMYAMAAEDVADKLSRDAQRRFTRTELPADGAPEFSYYLNFNALDRYNRAGITFRFDRAAKRFSYEGAAWREILRRYPRSPEAPEARKRLEKLASARASGANEQR